MVCKGEDIAAIQGAPPTPLLRIEGASVCYGEHQALHKIDLSICHGDRLAVIGPNGAGKTTLLRLLIGLELPSEGRIFWPGQRPRIGYVPQRLGFDKHFPLTVLEFLAVNHPKTGIWLGGVPPRVSKSISEALLITGTQDVKNQLLGTLSGGQLQRVLIAAALLQRPQILVMDEPSASIDNRGSDELRTMLSQLHESDNLTLVFVSHDLHFVAGLAKQVACLNSSICGLGEPQEILSSHVLGKAYGEGIRFFHPFEDNTRMKA
ncbi:MAG: metal ABC transporter ATP-binding protein [Verrucomicrobiota bacterium]